MPPIPNQVTHHQSVSAMTDAQRKDRIVALTISGLSQDQIAREIGTNQSTVSRLLREALNEATERRKMNTEQLVQLELETLNLAQRSIMPQVLKGNIKANAQLLRIMESRAKYLGLYAPIRVAIRIILDIVTVLNHLGMSPEEFFEVILADLLARANVLVMNGIVLSADIMGANNAYTNAMLSSGENSEIAPIDGSPTANAESARGVSPENDTPLDT